MTSESPDLLGRKSLYRHLERELGDLTTMPRVMTARQGKHHAHVERIFDHDGQVLLSISGQTIGRRFRSAQRPIAYVLVDLKRQRAQAAPHLQAFQSVYNLNVSKVSPGIAQRVAYRYGYRVEQAAPSQKPRFTVSQDIHFHGRVIRLKTKTSLKYRARASLRKLYQRLKFRLAQDPSTIPLQQKPSIRQSWLGSLSREKNLGQVLHELGIPRDQLQGFPTLSRDQRFSRFCNLSTQKAFDWLADRNYQFQDMGPRRDLLFSAEKPRQTRPQPTLKAVKYRQHDVTMTVQLGSGKTVTLSLTSGSKEAWNQILSTPIRQHAERSVVRQGLKQSEREPVPARKPPGRSYQRHSVKPPQFPEQKVKPLKVTERFRTQEGEVMKVQLKGGQSVYCSISDSSPEAVQTLLSPKVQMERQGTPVTPKREQNQTNQFVVTPQFSQSYPKPGQHRPKP